MRDPHTEPAEPDVDLELLAALLEGRLGGAERERAVRLLAQSDHAREVFADAVRTMNDPSVRTIVPLDPGSRTRRLRHWSVVIPIAAAAALIIAVIPTMRTQSPDRLVLATSELAAPVAGEPTAVTVLGESWQQRPWSVLRGGASPHADSSLSFRLGVRSLDLRVALELGDVALAEQLTGEMLGWLESVDLAETASARYRAFHARLTGATPAAELLTEAARAEQMLGELLHPFWFGFGQWCGAGELAARLRDGAFLESSLTTTVVHEALESGRFAEGDAGALREFEALRRDSTEGRFDRAHDLFQTLIRRHGG